MTDELTDLLATALDAYLLDRRVAVNHEAVLAAFPPRKADAMRAGLLWADVMERLESDDMGEVEVRLLSYSPEMHVWVRHTRRKEGTRQRYIRTDGFGPTLLAALQDLREKLR